MTGYQDRMVRRVPRMNLADYRLEPGLYQVGLYTIIRGGRDHWQLRDEFDDIVDIYPTCRAAMVAALRLERHHVASVGGEA